MDYVLRTTDVSKYYKKKAAVEHVSVSIARGEIYGFIGKNGAGKTTFMKMICGLTSPTSGEIEIFGKTGELAALQRKKIGNLIESPGVYVNMTAVGNLKCKSIALGIHKKNYEKELLELVGLGNVGRKKVKNFSMGMRQRLGIALALVGEPEFLVLDEPINGLDPQGIAELRESLLRIRDERKVTIMISSHILDELYKIADRFGFIHEGVFLEELTKEELDAKTSEYIRLVVDDFQLAMEILIGMDIQDLILREDNSIWIYEKLDETGKINTALVKGGVTVNEIYIVNENLEKYYLNLTGGDRNA